MEPLEVVLHPIADLLDANRMLYIRNRCAMFMTRDTKIHYADEQRIWFQETYLPQHLSGKMTAYLAEDSKGFAYGYAIIRLENDAAWLTGGLRKNYRGKGLGEKLFRNLVKLAKINYPDKEIMLEVRSDNTAAISLYGKIGFKIVNDTENGYVMRYAG